MTEIKDVGNRLACSNLVIFMAAVNRDHAPRGRGVSIFIKVDILKPFLKRAFKKKMSIFANVEQKIGNYAI